jgi:hypothetical protein
MVRLVWVIVNELNLILVTSIIQVKHFNYLLNVLRFISFNYLKTDEIIKERFHDNLTI